MKKLNKMLVTLLVAGFSFPILAAEQSDSREKVIELTPQEISSGSWRHIGDLSLSNQVGTSEDLISKTQEKISMKGVRYYQVTRMQMMENSSWSINVALYAPVVKTVN